MLRSGASYGKPGRSWIERPKRRNPSVDAQDACAAGARRSIGTAMEPSGAAINPPASTLAGIVATAKAVITDPAGFFRGMPKGGGYVDPIVFIVATSIASGLVALPLVFFGAVDSAAGGVLTFIGWMFVISPIVTVIGSFLWSAVFYGLWRSLGSQESYETAFRCSAYMTAITPIAIILNALPYIGFLITLGWGFGLTVIASSEVHGIKRQTARIAFGLVFGVFALISLGSQRAAQHAQVQTEKLNETMKKIDEMSPEEAGKAVGEFMKGFKGAVDDKSADGTGDKPAEGDAEKPAE